MVYVHELLEFIKSHYEEKEIKMFEKVYGLKIEEYCKIACNYQYELLLTETLFKALNTRSKFIHNLAKEAIKHLIKKEYNIVDELVDDISFLCHGHDLWDIYYSLRENISRTRNEIYEDFTRRVFTKYIEEFIVVDFVSPIGEHDIYIINIDNLKYLRFADYKILGGRSSIALNLITYGILKNNVLALREGFRRCRKVKNLEESEELIRDIMNLEFKDDRFKKLQAALSLLIY